MLIPTKQLRLLKTKVRPNNLVFDLIHAITAFASQNATYDLDRHNRRTMNRIVDKVVQSRLEECIEETRRKHPDVTDGSELIELMFNYKVTLVSDPVVHTLTNLLSQMGLRSYYSHKAIKDYIIREFNHRNRSAHGVYAFMEHDDILVRPDVKLNRRAVRTLIESL